MDLLCCGAYEWDATGRCTGRVRQGGLPVPAREPGAGGGGVRRLPARVVPLRRRVPPPPPHARHGAPPPRQAEAARAGIRRPGRTPGGHVPAPAYRPLHPSCLVPVCWNNITLQSDVGSGFDPYSRLELLCSIDLEFSCVVSGIPPGVSCVPEPDTVNTAFGHAAAVQPKDPANYGISQVKHNGAVRGTIVLLQLLACLLACLPACLLVCLLAGSCFARA